MRSARAAREVPLAPPPAIALWSDLERWPAFVEGFARVVEVDPRWPSVGTTVVWESGPEGRGRVHERVVRWEPAGEFVTDLREAPLGGGPPRLTGRQSVELRSLGDGAASASRVELRLDYELGRGPGSPGRLTDLLFVRRALRAALDRTLERFAREAAGEATR